METKSEVISRRYLLTALKKLDEGVPDDAYQQAIDIIEQKIADKGFGKRFQE